MNNIKKFLNNDLYKKVFAKAIKLDKKTNFALDLYKKNEFISQNPLGKLNNVPFYIKDNVDFADKVTTSASKTLKGHISLTTATFLKKILDEGAIPMGKSNLDEFAMGGTGLTSGFKPVFNVKDTSKIIGGSSSGSAVAVESGIVPFAIGSDTGDSVRQPAVWCDKVIGMKPTYGIISRYGLHAFAPSFDTVGFLTTNIEDQALLLSISGGFDEKDFTTYPQESYDFVSDLKPEIKKIKIGIFSTNDKMFDDKINKKFNLLKTKLENSGAEFIKIPFDEKLLKIIYPVYQSISFAEALSQLASINGLAFGSIKFNKDIYEDLKKERATKFVDLVKERMYIGAQSIAENNQEKIFIKAKKIRRLIINKIKKDFTKCDVIISPTGWNAPKIKNTSLHTSTNHDFPINYLQVSNMTGGPSLVMPFDKENNEVIYLEIMGDIFQDQKVLNVALYIEKMLKGEINE